MGLSLFSSCRCSYREAYRDNPLPNPNPAEFDTVRIESVGDCVVAEVHYRGCTNYEGRKILVYKGKTFNDIESADKLDPHFCNNGCLSPVARFEPTQRGWGWAIAFAGKICSKPTLKRYFHPTTTK